MLLKNRGNPLEWNTTKTAAKIKPPMTIHRTNVGKRQRAAGFKAYKPRRKESYKFPERTKRLRVARKIKKLIQRKKRPLDPQTVLYFDEHGIFHVPPGKLADRQLHAGKRFVFRKRKENPFKGELVSQKEASKSIKGGTRVHMAAAIWNGHALAETAADLIARSKPPPPPPPKLSKHGKPLGRKRKCDQEGWEPPERKNYDGPAHAQFMAEAARFVLAKMKAAGDTRKRPRIWCHQDGDRLHWTAECRKVASKYNLVFLDPAWTAQQQGRTLTYSPDLNPIEPTFKTADNKLKARQKAGPAKDVPETVARWKDAFTTQGQNVVNCCANLLTRCRDVIAAKGAATRH